MTKKTLFYRIFTSWIQEINPEHSGKFLSGSWVTFGLLTVKHLFCQRHPSPAPSTPLSTSAIYPDGCNETFPVVPLALFDFSKEWLVPGRPDT